MSLLRTVLPWSRASSLAALLPFFALSPAGAQSWGYANGTAGLSVEDRFTGLTVECAGAGLALGFSGFSTRLQAGAAYTVVITIDGIARRFRAIAFTGGREAGSVLRAAVTGGEATDLVEALRRGRKAVVATPAGRYEVPLAGSAQALEKLRTGCGFAD
ncbi:hypothetical protein [Jiella marina]|uniref:hypothetical protein n=1 Tax=Jiella sp. LLJ827 TaxID=2917712 RepID=UPI0021011655|nr:hypothetical protein [Jiella sp. LLJ827]MCQ0989168.1 hypothetical protein [Jiella sp. LLJ827]